MTRWFGHVTRKNVSEMTYNVSSGTLNSTIPCIWILILMNVSVYVVSIGYVLDGLPTVSEEHMKIEQQIELIKSWNLQPDFVINIKVVSFWILSSGFV